MLWWTRIAVSTLNTIKTTLRHPVRQLTDGMTLERAYVIQGEMCSHKTKQEPYLVYPVIMSKKVYPV
jgi:hypothetical protein